MKDLENFLIDENASLKDALVKIKNNKSRHVFVTLKETQKIIGVISERSEERRVGKECER